MREQRKRTLPARVVVYYLLAMVLFFQSGYGEVWNKLVAGLDWARRFRVRLALGMQPTPAAITYARQRLGWQVMQRLLEEIAGPLAGQEQEAAFMSGMRLVAVDGMCLDLPGHAGERGRVRLPGQRRRPGPFPQVRVVGLGECGTRAVLGAALSAPGHRGAAADPAAAGQALARRPAAGRPQLPVPRPAAGGPGGRGARAVAGQVRREPAGAGGAARRHVPVPDRRPGRLPEDTPPARRSEGHPRHHRPGHRVHGGKRGRQRDLGDLHPGHRHPRSRAAVRGAGRRGVRLPLAAGDLLRRAGDLDPRRRRGGAALQDPRR